MKGIDIFCASQAATSISCLSMDDPSSSSSTIHLGGSGRAIDRYNPIIRDPRRFGGGSCRTLPYVPSCSSHSQTPPINPKPASHSHQHTHHRHHNHQNKNGTTGAMNNSSKPSYQKSPGNSTNTKKKVKVNNSNRSSSAAVKPPTPNDQEKEKSSGSVKPASVHEPSDLCSSSSSFGNRKSWSRSSVEAAVAGDFISPPVSSRYLLSDQAAFFNLISEDFDPLLKLLPAVVEAEPPINHSMPNNHDGNNNSKALQKDDPSMSRSPDQVVVLRVSLHCKGCERKMRKHISRMEGVSSFNIDFAAKKVTVVGNVTPLGVLASISKVKNAQLWTPATAAPSFSHPNSSEISRNRQTTLLS